MSYMTEANDLAAKLRRQPAPAGKPGRRAAEPRAIYQTRMADGTSLIEIGDTVLHLWPRERRELTTMLVGDAVQYSNIQARVEAGTLATGLAADLLALKTEMAAQIQDLKRQLTNALKGEGRPRRRWICWARA